MARLEDQVTPIELLNIIRGGTVKKDVLKEYRTTEQELAKMLLPLYRSGELTMEEFNDFFKGLALTPKKSDDAVQSAPSVPRPEDEAPSEILRSLSEDRERPSADDAKKHPAAPPEPKAEKKPEANAVSEPAASPEPRMGSVESAIVEEIQAEELFEEGELEEEFLEEPDIEVEGALQSESEMKELDAVVPPKVAAEHAATPPPPAPQPEVRAPAASTEPPKPPAVEPPVSDAEAVRKALNTIIAKLSSMEGLLARIEKNLRKP